jgi:hypothetical protein
MLIGGVMAYNYVKQKDASKKKGGLPHRLKKTRSQKGSGAKKLLIRV